MIDQYAETPADDTTDISPLFNSLFIRIFGKTDSESVTRSLVNSIFREVGLEPIDEIDSISAEHELPNGSFEVKTPRLDVRVLTQGRAIDLEAQTYADNIPNRTVYYASQLMVENTQKGTKYDELPQCVVVVLLDDRPLFPDAQDFIVTSRLHWTVDGRVREETPQDTDRFVIVVVELEKVRKRYTQVDSDVLSSEALAWFYMLTRGYSETEEVTPLMEEFPSMEEFARRYGYASSDPKLKIAYKDALSAERDYDMRQKYYARLKREAQEKGYEEGLEQGIEQGIEQGTLSSVRSLMESMGWSASQAMDALKVPEESRGGYLEELE